MNVNLTGIRACVFDAYGSLFDVNSAAQRTQDALRGKWQQFAEVWRAKQLQYTWLRSLTGKLRETRTSSFGGYRIGSGSGKYRACRGNPRR
jgi:hypothetical protein